LFQQTFADGVAPLLSQFLKNQQTLIQGLGSALEQSLQISNPSSIPATLQKALSELAAGNIQGAAETVSTGLIQVAFPFLPSLLQPLNNFVAVVNQLPNIVLLGSLAVIQPPLALVQATGQALQGIVDAVTSGNPLGVVNAIVNVPAVMLDGFLNGYTPTQTGGLLTPGLGTLSILVNIRNLIVTAITPAPLAAATTTSTEEVTATKTAAAKVVTLDVAPQGTEAKATETSSAATATDTTEGKAADTKDAAATDGIATTTAKDETSTSTSTAETGSASDATDTATKGETTTKDDTTGKDDRSSAAGATSDTGAAAGATSDTGAAATAKGDSTTKKSETKKDSGEKSATAKADKK
jgi:hypothetical protein